MDKRFFVGSVDETRIQRSNCWPIQIGAKETSNDKVLWGLRFAFARNRDLLRRLRCSRSAGAAGEPGTATCGCRNSDAAGGPGKLGDRRSPHQPSTAGQS